MGSAALLVCIACYVGSVIDTRVTFPRVGTAVIFPPYAVVVVALLVSRRRNWPLYLLASSVGNFLPHQAGGGPVAHVLLCELANYSRALIAVFGIRALGGGGGGAGGRVRLDRLRGMGALIVAAVAIGPAAAALIGAGSAVTFAGAGDYWLTWRCWFLSNALTGLTLLPALLAGAAAFRDNRDRIGKVTLARVVEGVLLAVALLACGAWVFILPHGWPATLPAARLYAPLPLLLWAAVRFGPGGASASLLATTAFAVWGAVAGRGPFASASSAANAVLELHLFLIATALPLLLLASLVAEQHATSSALRASERDARRQLAHLAALYQTAPTGLAFVGSDLRYVNVNDHLAEFNGLPAAAHVGRTLHEVLGPALADGIEPVYRGVIDTGVPVLDVELRAPVAAQPGVERVWLASHHPVRDDAGTIIGVNTVVREITDRKRAEEQLRQSEERYRSVVESQMELVCRYLPDTTLTFVNAAYCRFFGRRPEELIGRPFLELIPEGSRAASLAHVESIVRAPRTVAFEHEVLLPDGSRGWQQWVDHVILDADGRVVELQGIGRDLTERWRAEQAARASQAALRASYRQVRDLAGRLIAAQEAERARIARELHDDVNQQLAALSIAMSMIKQQADVPELRDELAALERRTASIADCVRHLSHGLHPGVLRHAGLPAALKAHCAEFHALHGIDLTFRADERIGSVPLPPDDALCLYRVAQEALSNVARHAGARRVRVTLAEADGGLALDVADDGRGFDLADAGRRAGGLGLSSAEERVRLADGTLSIDAAPGRGTTVRAWVPLRRPDEQPQEYDYATT